MPYCNLTEYLMCVRIRLRCWTLGRYITKKKKGYKFCCHSVYAKPWVKEMFSSAFPRHSFRMKHGELCARYLIKKHSALLSTYRVEFADILTQGVWEPSVFKLLSVYCLCCNVCAKAAPENPPPYLLAKYACFITSFLLKRLRLAVLGEGPFLESQHPEESLGYKTVEKLSWEWWQWRTTACGVRAHQDSYTGWDQKSTYGSVPTVPSPAIGLACTARNSHK